MYCISSNTTNTALNLALEEFLLKQKNEEYFILSINDTSVVAGKHQCIHREVNTRYINENNIPVFRRISGGGTVFHDEGNLNFCFIRNCDAGKQVDFPRHIKPVIDFLGTLGVKALIEGSDVKVNGLKISGNAEHVYRNRVLHHGTILWEASLDTLRNCIRKDTSAYRTRAVASRPSPVMNLSDLVKNISGIEEFASVMMEYFITASPGASLLRITDEEKSQAENISERYNTWEWNYAYGPEYEVVKELTIGGKKTSLNISVRDGLIQDCSIAGNPELNETCKKLSGCRHMPEDVRNVLGQSSGMDIFDFF